MCHMPWGLAGRHGMHACRLQLRMARTMTFHQAGPSQLANVSGVKALAHPLAGSGGTCWMGYACGISQARKPSQCFPIR